MQNLFCLLLFFLLPKHLTCSVKSCDTQKQEICISVLILNMIIPWLKELTMIIPKFKKIKQGYTKLTNKVISEFKNEQIIIQK